MRSLDDPAMEALLQAFVRRPLVMRFWAKRARAEHSTSSLLVGRRTRYEFSPEEIQLVLAKAALLGVSDA